MKIDAVITWVDGADPNHRRKRIKYGDKKLFSVDDCAGESRYSNLGEIFWCVASLNKYAPWLNKLYIVTDGQDPGIERFLEETFPEGHIPVEIIDHKVIFKDYEEFLPTFNSISIESMTWRIPELSEYYIELNDDFLLISPVNPEDFFVDENTLVCYASKHSQLLTSLTRKFKKIIKGEMPFTFKGVMLNAARISGEKKYYLKLDHTPRSLSKKCYSDFFKNNPDILKSNIKHRFRSYTQFTPEELLYMLKYSKGECILRNVKNNLFYLKPKKDNNYVENKLKALSQSNSYKFLCINSLNLANEEDQKQIVKWVKNRLCI